MKNLLFLLALVVFGGLQRSAATTYYVATDGVDETARAGLTISEAWATVAYALDNINAGDTIAMIQGTYNERISVDISGMAGSPIVLRNYAADTVIISGLTSTGQDALLEIIDQNYIVVQGLIFQDNVQNDAQGILVSGACEGIEIKNNTFVNISFSSKADSIPSSSDNAQPIIVYGSDALSPVKNLVISGNGIFDCVVGQSEGLAVNGNVDSFSIVDNALQNITNIGIDVIGGEGTSILNDQPRNGLVSRNDVDACRSPYATAAGIYLDGALDVVVERNEVTSCEWGIEVGSENVGIISSGNVVRNNVLYLNREAGIAVGGIGGIVSDVLIRNNTILGSDADNFGDPTAQVFISTSTNVQLINNIIFKLANSTSAIIYAENAVNLQMDYNIYYAENEVDSTFEINGLIYDGLSALMLGTAQDENSKYEDPMLKSVIPANFYLEATSPAIDAGDTNTVVSDNELDYRGEVRLINAVVDIGATEFNGPLPVTFLRPFAASLEENRVYLSWHTAVEINNDRFVVERSQDLERWDNLLSVPGRGKSFLYEEYDLHPLEGKSYYRLRQMDLDGTESFSGIHAIHKEPSLEIYPNPASKFVNISGITNDQNKIYLIDMRGLTVREWSDIKDVRTLDLNGLNSGIYLLKVLDTSSTKSFKLFLE